MTWRTESYETCERAANKVQKKASPPTRQRWAACCAIASYAPGTIEEPPPPPPPPPAPPPPEAGVGRGLALAEHHGQVPRELLRGRGQCNIARTHKAGIFTGCHRDVQTPNCRPCPMQQILGHRGVAHRGRRHPPRKGMVPLGPHLP